MRLLVQSCAVALVLSTASACGSALHCGEGTREEGNRCIPVEIDAGGGPATDGGNTGEPDAGADGGFDPSVDGYAGVALYLGDTLPAPKGVAEIPVGGATSFQLRGKEASGLAAPISSPTLSYSVTPNDGTVRLRVADGIAWLVGLKPGRVLVRGTVVGSLGPLSDEELLDVKGAFPTALEVGTGQDDVAFNAWKVAGGARATLPVDLRARVAVRIKWTWQDATGQTFTTRARLHSDDLELVIEAGSAAVEPRGRIRGLATGTATVGVTFAPLDTGLTGPSAQGFVEFVPEAPETDLILFASGLGDVAELSRSRRPAGSADPTELGPDLGMLWLMEDIPQRRLHLGVLHQDTSARYVRWLAPSATATRVSGNQAAVTIEPDFTVRWAQGGVALWTASAHGFDAPVLIAAHYPRSLPVRYRVDPGALSFVLGSTTACTQATMFVTVGSEPERALAPLEALAVDRRANDPQEPYSRDIIRRAPTPLHFCCPTVRYTDITSPAKGSYNLSFLAGSMSQLRANLPYTVTF